MFLNSVATLCLLIHLSKALTYNVIIDMLKLTSAILFIFYLLFVLAFCLFSFSCLLGKKFHFHLPSCFYSCLEDPMDRGAWWAAVHGVAKSQI